MEQQDGATWRRARRAREQLTRRYQDRPEVSLIDIGRSPDEATAGQALALRIHLRGDISADVPPFPTEVEGFPVLVIRGDYAFEGEQQAQPRSEPAADEGPAADDLQQIEGIGPAIAARLRDVGVSTFAQLAALSPEEIARLLGERARVSARTIAEKDWVGKALALAERSAAGAGPKAQDEPGGQHYSLVHVTLTLDDSGKVLSTLVKCFPGQASDRWAGWDSARLEQFMLTQAGVIETVGRAAAGLPVSQPTHLDDAAAPAEPAQPAGPADAAAPAEPAQLAGPADAAALAEPAPEALSVEVLGLDLETLPAHWDGVGRGEPARIQVSARFRLAGSAAAEVAGQHTPFELRVLAREPAAEGERQLASGIAYTRPAVTEYTAVLRIAPPAGSAVRIRGAIRLPRQGVSASSAEVALPRRE